MKAKEAPEQTGFANGTEDSIRIHGKDIPARNAYLPQDELKFFPDNPRIYSIVHGSAEEPMQPEIEARLVKLDHVKQLVQSIEANGGLIDALIVRDGDLVVLEGNSRLAAYRILAQRNPIEWGRVKCKLLPADIDEDLIFQLLGEYHIIGRKDWKPFEQAGLLYRRHQFHGVTADKMASEMGLSVRTINDLIRVYKFMVEHNEENPDRWSYYEVYLKSYKIARARDENIDLDNAIVQKIRTGEITRAVDIREKVAKIAVAGKTVIKQFIQKPKSFEECYELADKKGVNNQLLKQINRFRKTITDPSVRKDIEEMPDNQRATCTYDLKKIHNTVDKLLKKL